MYLLNLLTQLVTSQLLLNQQFIFCTFLQITSELKEIVYYSKRPISLLFHALSHKTTNKTIKFYCQCPLNATLMNSRGGRSTKIYVYLLYEGTISFYVYIVPLGLINIFLHVECDKISCGLQPTRFSRNFL